MYRTTTNTGLCVPATGGRLEYEWVRCGGPGTQVRTLDARARVPFFLTTICLSPAPLLTAPWRHLPIDARCKQIRYTSMKAVDRREGLTEEQCSWSVDGKSDDWLRMYIGARRTELLTHRSLTRCCTALLTPYSLSAR